MASSNENYPWPSTLNISNFVSVKPWLKDKETSTNYKIWREQMLCLLESQDLLGFINGEIKIPECGNGSPSSNEKHMKIDKHKLWRRTDRLVKGWILGSMGDDGLNALVGLNTTSSSREVWEEVRNIFSQKKPVTAFPIKVLNPKSDGSVQEEDRIVKVESEISNSKGSHDFSKYLPLYQAVIRNDWKAAKEFFDQNENAEEAIINTYNETALHVAVGSRNRNDFVKKWLKLMSNDALALKNNMGHTALHVAALVGNYKAAILLVKRNPDLLYIFNRKNDLPVHFAAMRGHKDILRYLIDESKPNVKNSPFVGQLGINLLIRVIVSESVDVALELVKTYTDLATSKDEIGYSALTAMAARSRVFPSGERFNWWQKFIYSHIPLTLTPKISHIGDNENPQVNNSTNEGCSKLTAKVWTAIEHLVPTIKDIRHKKVLHKQAIELVQYLCQKLESWPGTEDSRIHKESLILAAENGIHEVVELITETFPMDIFSVTSVTGDNIMSITIKNRHENVYNAIHQRNYPESTLSRLADSSYNNLMHLSAKLAPPHKLNLVTGAALQMQRELQWFKEMESIVNISLRELKNRDGETPRTLFTKEHEDLKRQGEKWMKDTSSSCSITAALIATVVFAAAFTVPGGIDSNTGIPIFWDKTAFILFAIADIISLFTSVTSLLMFLAILTSRYAEEDFSKVLPSRLCIGLLTLFVSITFMMVAFSAATCLTFRKKIGSLLIIPVVALACLPITSFVFLQYPILLDVMHSTYGPGIFRKRSDRSLY